MVLLLVFTFEKDPQSRSRNSLDPHLVDEVEDAEENLCDEVKVFTSLKSFNTVYVLGPALSPPT